jgi:hypothetical protein
MESNDILGRKFPRIAAKKVILVMAVLCRAEHKARKKSSSRSWRPISSCHYRREVRLCEGFQQHPLLPVSGIRRDPRSWHLGRSEVVEATARFAERGIDAGPVTIVLDLFRGRI